MTERIVPRRERITAQHGALEMFVLLRRHYPAIETEERRNRAAMPRMTKAAVVDAVLGALDRGTYTSVEAAERLARIERG